MLICGSVHPKEGVEGFLSLCSNVHMWVRVMPCCPGALWPHMTSSSLLGCVCGSKPSTSFGMQPVQAFGVESPMNVIVGL